MEIIRVGTLQSEIQAIMHNVEIMTGGYVTEINNLKFQKIERIATSTGMDKIDYFVNENGEIITFHYAHTLNLQQSVCAIDYFPDYNQEQINKISGVLSEAIKKHRILRTVL